MPKLHLPGPRQCLAKLLLEGPSFAQVGRRFGATLPSSPWDCWCGWKATVERSDMSCANTKAERITKWMWRKITTLPGVYSSLWMDLMDWHPACENVSKTNSESLAGRLFRVGHGPNNVFIKQVNNNSTYITPNRIADYCWAMRLMFSHWKSIMIFLACMASQCWCSKTEVYTIK